MKKTLCIIAGLFVSTLAVAQEPTLIRLGRGFAAEEQLWLMSARPDLTPNQGKKYKLNQILFHANPERFQAFLAGELAGGTAPRRARPPRDPRARARRRHENRRQPLPRSCGQAVVHHAVPGEGRWAS